MTNMDMDPYIPKAVWGFNGTERPGAVYLAAVLAGHNQKGLPAQREGVTGVCLLAVESHPGSVDQDTRAH